MKKQSEEDSENDQTIVTKEETNWQTITDGIDASNDYLNSSAQSMIFLCMDFPFRFVCNTLLFRLQTIFRLYLKQLSH